ncbi:tetraspanin family protein [Leucobacter viscericola]|uniref:Tetraspanin family protein n=1 Tax=Leucobacter viscericola TaxID=2714935 RepID=A0A6G7XHF3_9MICO|nr:tetraspanin family protein [Leucobacter viscericola]QIK63942.1 tetraspanin family protein [Leucobacter viscericola]
MTRTSSSDLERFPRQDDASRDSPTASLVRSAMAAGESMLNDGTGGLTRGSSKSPFTKPVAIAMGSVITLVGLSNGVPRLGTDENLVGIVILVSCSVLALLAFGMIPQRAPQGSFRLINATVMTRAEQPTADSWVHLASTRAMRITLILGFFLGSLSLLAMAVYAFLQGIGVVSKPNSSTNSSFLIVISVIVAAVGCLGVWISSLLVGRRLRNGSFGTRPSGVALGETSVAVRVPGKNIEIPWVQIKRVEPVIVPTRNAEDFSMIRLALMPGGMITERAQMLATDGYQVPTDALYTALRWYHAHPEARRELGRVEGQQRLQAWCDQAVS